MLFGFLFKSEHITYVQAFTYIGFIVMAVSGIILITRFRREKTEEAAASNPAFAAA